MPKRQSTLPGKLILTIACQVFSLAIFSQDESALIQATSSNATEQVAAYFELSSKTINSNPDTALYFARQGLYAAEKSHEANDRLMAYSNMARIHAKMGNYYLAMKYYRQTHELARKEKMDSVIAVGLNGLGVCQWHLGKHAEALENLYMALRMREQMGDIRGAAMTRANIGMIYQSENKIQLAEKYVNEALILLEKDPDPNLQLQNMHTLANIYGMQGKIKEALLLDEEGLKIAEKINNEFVQAMFFDNMGNCYLYGRPPNYAKAMEYFRKALQIDSLFGNKKQMSDCYLNMGTVYLEQKRYAEAIPYLQHSIALSTEAGYVQGKFQTLQLLANAYRESGHQERAYTTLLQSQQVKDSMISSNSEARIAELQTLYETEKTHQQINLQKSELSKKNYIIIGSILLLIANVWLAISYYHRHRLKQKTRLQTEILRQQEIATKAVLEAEERERQRIARDLHDGVGQMMSAAKMNLSAFESNVSLHNDQHQTSLAKIMSLVDESCKEIRQVSHNMMQHTSMKKNLAVAVQDFLDKIDTKALNVQLSTEGMEERIDPNTEIILYRVIQECVNNVIKHADATRLDISMVKDSEGLSITIEDNGKGFDVTQRDQFEGIGLKNIHTRVDYLKGTVDIDSSPGRGTVVTLQVPVA